MQNVKHTAAEQAALARFVAFKDSMSEAQLIEMARTGEMPLPSVVSVNGRIVARG